MYAQNKNTETIEVHYLVTKKKETNHGELIKMAVTSIIHKEEKLYMLH
jgi:hypothetical protein